MLKYLGHSITFKKSKNGSTVVGEFDEISKVKVGRQDTELTIHCDDEYSTTSSKSGGFYILEDDKGVS